MLRYPMVRKMPLTSPVVLFSPLTAVSTHAQDPTPAAACTIRGNHWTPLHRWLNSEQKAEDDQ